MTGSEEVVISNEHLSVSLWLLGATIHKLVFDGVDVVLGYDSAAAQQDCLSHPYVGTIGRVSNRIAGAAFALNGTTYTLAANSGANNLHGGARGFDRAQWALVSSTADSAAFAVRSGDGDNGFPRALTATVAYALRGAALRIEYAAALDAGEGGETVASLTTHAYFNLAGFVRPSILDHVAHFPHALGHLKLDSAQIPTGELVRPLDDPAMDFSTAPKSFGRDIASVQEFKGYDHFYMLKDCDEIAHDPIKKKEMILAAVVSSPKSGIQMQVVTDAVGFQLYTGNFLDASIPTKSSHPKGFYEKHGAFCLETSAPPDAVNSTSESVRATTLLKKGEKWSQNTVYSFSKI
ncbi:galactose mutarotase-like domain-containing protein [Obelidium mucronatum]|nr:galactose mutarotase-like domain-containing protein [Obelidium mucronatum]